MLKQIDDLDLSKDKRQRQIVALWKGQGAKGTLLAVTGFGKTRAMLLGANNYATSTRLPQNRKKITIVVPSNKLYNDWTEHFKECPCQWDIYTIQGLIRETKISNSKPTGLLIVDEIHRFTSEEFGRIFDIFNYQYIFGATATLDHNDPKYKIIKEKAPIIDEIKLQEARENDWVSEFQIYNLAVPLTPKQREFYDHIHEKYKKYFATFEWDFGLAMDCLTDNEVCRDYARELGWDYQAVKVHAVNWKRNVDKRKNFLYNLPSKIDVAKKIVQKFSKHIFITFSLTTDFADELSDALGEQAVSYHSDLQTHIANKATDELVAIGIDTENGKRYQPLNTDLKLTWKQVKKHFDGIKLTRKGKKTRRKEALKTFSDPSNNVRVVSTAKALDEGFDVPNINASIVCSGTSKSRQSIQRLGRMLRYQEGKTAFQVELYAPHTQDERWLKSRQQKSINIKWINSIDQIDI